VTISGQSSSSHHRVPAAEEMERLYRFQKMMGEMEEYVKEPALLEGVQHMPRAQESFN
jgi:hypothetical protein